MKQEPNRVGLRLRPIPANTVVHTPTEAEAKELLAILHENGYKWYCSDKEEGWENFGNETCYRINSHDNVYYASDREWYETICEYCILPVLTLTDFKERYCEEEKPQPKVKVGDTVLVVTNDYNLKAAVGGAGIITKVMSHGYHLKSPTGEWFVTDDDITLCATSDTKDDTKGKEPGTKENNPENSQLNLCELIGDRDGIHVYCPTCGEVTLQAWDRGKHTKPLIFAQNDTSIVVRTFANGKAYAGGECIIFPSRALYEQYPLDPYTAWMKWQEEQKRYALSVAYVGNGIDAENSMMFFRTPADRDKAIEEIKAIIEKHSKQPTQ